MCCLNHRTATKSQVWICTTPTQQHLECLLTRRTVQCCVLLHADAPASCSTLSWYAGSIKPQLENVLFDGAGETDGIGLCLCAAESRDSASGHGRSSAGISWKAPSFWGYFSGGVELSQVQAVLHPGLWVRVLVFEVSFFSPQVGCCGDGCCIAALRYRLKNEVCLLELRSQVSHEEGGQGPEKKSELCSRRKVIPPIFLLGRRSLILEGSTQPF